MWNESYQIYKINKFTQCQSVILTSLYSGNSYSWPICWLLIENSFKTVFSKAAHLAHERTEVRHLFNASNVKVFEEASKSEKLSFYFVYVCTKQTLHPSILVHTNTDITVKPYAFPFQQVLLSNRWNVIALYSVSLGKVFDIKKYQETSLFLFSLTSTHT